MALLTFSEKRAIFQERCVEKTAVAAEPIEVEKLHAVFETLPGRFAELLGRCGVVPICGVDAQIARLRLHASVWQRSRVVVDRACGLSDNDAVSDAAVLPRLVDAFADTASETDVERQVDTGNLSDGDGGGVAILAGASMLDFR